MLEILFFIGLILFSYLLGCFSAARLIAKTYRSLDIYKVGTGHPDTQNIYDNVDKALGIFTGVIDVGKIFFFLVLLNTLLHNSFLNEYLPFLSRIATKDHLLLIGFFMIIGHCFPITHHFRGGRGLFTYIGYITFFAPWPMFIMAFLALILVIFFKQIRFAQYMIVLLPPFLNFFFEKDAALLGKLFLAAILLGIINYFVSKKLGEI
ncbi:MAG: glycerol-3-phosphate acyltransferase [Candidatus Cloacimonetes bacterium]|nr:glycerol-3-phosphate acyltransferase [Candidatus Cloacimonadota bacterium]